MLRAMFALVGVIVTVIAMPLLAANAPQQKVDDQLKVSPNDWPWWRGPTRNGVAVADQNPPLAWSDTENVLWKAPIPGRGHGSPTVVGDQVFVATAEKEPETQSVLCFDRQTGRELWKTEVHRGNFVKGGNDKATQASTTVACDGERLYVNFPNSDAIIATALSLDGKILWQTKVTDYVLHQGYGSSPALYQSLVIIGADNKGGGAVAGLDRKSGKIVWKRERPKTPNYASPIILHVEGRDQLLFTGCDLVTSLDPLTGKELWEIKGATTECVTSTVTDGHVIFTSGGYPRNHLAAVVADGTGKIAWENNTRVYVPSMVTRDGYLYAVTDAGVAMCWETATGQEKWKSRLGGTFDASPILVGDRLFATNESGKTFIFKATPDAFELLGENQLGDEDYATPAICGSRIYMRVAFQKDGKRQEMLYCLGKK